VVDVKVVDWRAVWRHFGLERPPVNDFSIQVLGKWRRKFKHQILDPHRISRDGTFGFT
jgi:hypothetical protein